ncbi:MAG: pyridoxamine 5'-phosphate oxidase family protein [Pseudomonadota bacterium]
MAKQFDHITDEQRAFVEAQQIYFTGSAAQDGRVNVSPKGQDSLRILGPNRLIWLNLTGSGNETAGHLLDCNRMTLMWCSFDKKPLIYRVYGSAKTVHKGDADWDALYGHFPPNIGARQIFDVDVEMTQTSCGYAVPLMEFGAVRDTLDRAMEAKGDDPAPRYWAENNMITIDGKPTGMPEQAV